MESPQACPECLAPLGLLENVCPKCGHKVRLSDLEYEQARLDENRIPAASSGKRLTPNSKARRPLPSALGGIAVGQGVALVLISLMPALWGGPMLLILISVGASLLAIVAGTAMIRRWRSARLIMSAVAILWLVSFSMRLASYFGYNFVVSIGGKSVGFKPTSGPDHLKVLFIVLSVHWLVSLLVVQGDSFRSECATRADEGDAG